MAANSPRKDAIRYPDWPALAQFTACNYLGQGACDQVITSEYFSMIDVRIELSQVPGGWNQVACVVVQHDEQIPVLEIPGREDEVFPSKDIAIATLKGRVAFELQQSHLHESGDSVRWQIIIHPS